MVFHPAALVLGNAFMARTRLAVDTGVTHAIIILALSPNPPFLGTLLDLRV